MKTTHSSNLLSIASAAVVVGGFVFPALADVPAASPQAALSGQTSPALAVPTSLGQDILIEATAGAGSASLVPQLGAQPMLTVGANALYRLGVAEVGGELQLAQAGFGYSMVSGGGLAGVRFEPARWLRLEALADLGAQHVTGIGNDFLSSASGNDSATLPFVGAGVGVSLMNAGHLVAGLWASATDSLGQTTVRPTENTCFFGCSTTTPTYAVGGPTFSLSLRLGYDWGL